jgi:non-ribosomal peptide synthetase component F
VSAAAGPTPEAPPISVAQEAIFYQCLLAPDARSYNETISIRKDGEFDVGAFRRAFNEIVRRHAAWRTSFEVLGGRPVQVVSPPSELALPLLDLSALGPDAEGQAVRVVAEVSKAPYDLRRGPLLRPRLIRFAPDHHRLYLAFHHLVFDGFSVPGVVLPELIALYRAFCAGRPSPLAEPATTYADYARFEQEWMVGGRAGRRLEHWHRRLAEVPFLELPMDRRRPASPRHRGAVRSLALDAARVAALRAIGQGVGATLFQVLSATWAVVLSCLSGQDDVVFSTAAGLRQRPEFDALVGCSITPLVLRVDTGGDPPFGELVRRTRNEVLDGLEHLVPFERIIRALGPRATPGANPFYQTMVVLEPAVRAPDPDWSVHQMENEITDAVGASKLDLELGLDERGDGTVEGRLVYDTDLFEPSSIDRLAERWLGVVARVAEDPAAPVSSLVRPGEADRRSVVAWNATATFVPARSVHELIAARIASSPDAPALSTGDHELTYGQLGARADAVARRLAGAGIGPGDVVALCAAPSAELVASALGVMGAGAAYLLLDPSSRVEDLESVVADAGAALVYADPPLATQLTGRTLPIDAAGPGATAPGAPGLRDGGVGREVCCIHYGPRGEGGGVAFSHRAVASLVLGLAADVGIGPSDTVLVLPDMLYRASVVELWMPLAAGARIVLAAPGVAADGEALRSVAHKERVSFLHASPDLWRQLVTGGLRAIRGLGALCGGPPDEDLADAIGGRVRVLFAAFGTPETTLYATWGRVDPAGPVTVGRPAANTRAYVLDRNDGQVPVEAVGRLVVAGDCVAAPYGSRAGCGRFVADPGGGPGRAVDLAVPARWRPDGTLQVLGPAT